VYYGTSSSLGEVDGVDESTTTHSVTLDELEAGSVYHYVVSSCDSSLNCANSTTNQFLALEDSEQPFVEADLREYHNSWTISFTGRAKPFSFIKLYLNGAWDRYTDADQSGDFAFSGVGLSSSVEPNVIKLVAVDVSNNEVSKEYELYPDFEPPELNITKFETITLANTITVEGFVNEYCNISFDAHPETDTVAPAQVTNLNSTHIYTNSVDLEWDESTESDFYVYSLYRNGVRITTTTYNMYTDSALDSNTTYEYQVAAVDESCNEGQKSETLTVTTSQGGPVYGINETEVEMDCNEFSFHDEFNASGSFANDVSLGEGLNYVTITATDRAGSYVTYSNTTLYDTGSPEILDTNLEMYGGLSYDRDIVVSGNVSEECTIYIYLNNDSNPTSTAETSPTEDPNIHSFSVEVTLNRDVEHEAEPTSPPENGTYLFSTASAWDNRITIVAVDAVGQNDSIEETIVYALCSVGSWFRIDKTPLTPDMLTPRLIIMGMAQLGMGINITWQGSTSYNATIRDVRLVPRTLNQDEEDDWDLDWVSGYSLPTNSNKTQGYATIKIKAIDPSDGENWTWYEKEENISRHRENECATIPGMGCFRVPLVLEIDFETDIYDEVFTQKECWDLEIGMDQRINPDVLPERFLKKAVQFLNKLIKQIEKVLDPLKKIEKYAIYACMASWAILFMKGWTKRGVCELMSHTPGGQFDTKKAGYGAKACVKAYPASDSSGENCGSDNDKCDNCQSCAEALQQYSDFERKTWLICDRIFCPTAPTFMKYVEDSTEFTENHDPVYDIGLGTEDFILYSDTTDCGVAKSQITDKAKYYTEKALEDYEQRASTKDGKPDCTRLHIPNEQCCANEYMERYDSVCGIPDARLFNELKESACIEAQERHNTDAMEKLNCNEVWNAVAGFCEPDGMQPADYVSSNIYVRERGDERLFIKVVHPESSAEDEWIIEPGSVDKEIEGTATAGTQGEHRLGESTPIQQNTYFVPLKTSGLNLAGIFIDNDKEVKDLATACPGVSGSSCGQNKFCSELINEVHSGSALKLYELCKDVHAKLGSGKDQVVDPTSGLLRSAQCLCLPALKTYLSFYHDMAVAVRNCFQTILYTGDGSSGMCQAVLTVYICDLIWDIIRCFKEKYSSDLRGSREGGFRGIVDRLIGAGEDVTGSIQGRYGDTAPWRAMFSEKKIVHALCLWAFTGTWDLDFTSFFEGNYSVPIESQGMMYPCERRFVSFDPSTTPAGKATYLYHIGAGLVAGAELTNVHLDLVCSQGICNTYAGYKDGQCDCRQGTQSVNSGWSGINPQMAPGDVLSEDVYVQHSGYRYDSAVLYWTYVDNQGSTVTQNASCEFTKAGADEPAYCQYSLVHMMYLCNIGEDECIGYFDEDPYVKSGSDYVNHPLKFTVPVTHGGSTSETTYNKCTKFLGVEVKNKDTNRVIYTSSEYKAVNFNGSQDITFNIGTIKDDWLSASHGLRMDSADSSGVVTEALSLSNDGWYRIKLDSRGANAICKEYSNKIECDADNNKDTFSGTNKVVSGGTVTYDGNKYKVDTNKRGELSSCIVIEKPSTTSDRSCANNNPYNKFQAAFTLYDAEEYGSTWRKSGQVTSYSGEKQEKTIDFELFCTEQGSDTASGVVVPDVSLMIDGSSSSPRDQLSGEKEVKITVSPKGKSIDAVTFLEGSLDIGVILSCGDTCGSDDEIIYTGKYKDWSGVTYKAVVYYDVEETVDSNTITLLQGPTPAGEEEVADGNPESSPMYYCGSSAEWKSSNDCGAADHYLYYNRYSIWCRRSSPEVLKEMPGYVSSKSYNWGKTLDHCERNMYVLVTA